MKKALFVALVSLAILNFNCATQLSYVSGEKCEAPVWNDGDSWKFIGGGDQAWEERFVGSTLRQTPQKGFYAIFNVPFIGLKIFPLWVGKRVEGVQQARTLEGIDLMYHYSFRVVGMDDLKVTAGTFKVYKIEFKLSTIHGQEGVAYYDYSPETKSIVKFETKSQILYQSEDYELSFFNLKGKIPKVSIVDIKPPSGVDVISIPQFSEGDAWTFKTDKGEFIYKIERVNDFEVIMNQLLGHKTLTMTLRYAHLAPSHKVRAVAALDGVLNDKVPTVATQELGIRHQPEARA